MDQNRKKMLLALLILLFFISLGYRLMNPFEQQQVTELTYTSGHIAEKRSKTSTIERFKQSDSIFLTALFKTPPHHSNQITRNIFWAQKGFNDKTESTVLEEKTTTKESVAAEVAAPQVLTPGEVVQQELGDLKIFGFLKKSDDRVLLFIERGKDIFVIKEGDRLDGKYEVRQITEKILSIKAESLDETIHIDLSQLKNDELDTK